jgi:hypothetical protein
MSNDISDDPERDIVDQLQSYAFNSTWPPHAEVPKSVLHAAVNEIEQLRAALSDVIDAWDRRGSGNPSRTTSVIKIARAALRRVEQ